MPVAASITSPDHAGQQIFDVGALRKASATTVRTRWTLMKRLLHGNDIERAFQVRRRHYCC
jgi:hypothetical protein